MSERLEKEYDPSLEGSATREYIALKEAWGEQDSAVQVINNLFGTTADRGEAEKIVIKGGEAERLERASKKMKEAVDAWLKALKESQG